MDWRPDSDILASVGLDGTLRIWDASTGQQMHAIDVGSKLYTVDISPDGEQIAYGGETPDGQTEIFETIQFPIEKSTTESTP